MSSFTPVNKPAQDSEAGPKSSPVKRRTLAWLQTRDKPDSPCPATEDGSDAQPAFLDADEDVPPITPQISPLSTDDEDNESKEQPKALVWPGARKRLGRKKKSKDAKDRTIPGGHGLSSLPIYLYPKSSSAWDKIIDWRKFFCCSCLSEHSSNIRSYTVMSYRHAKIDVDLCCALQSFMHSLFVSG
jgi:hypothetical protein